MKDVIFTIYRYKIDKIPVREGDLFGNEDRKLNPKNYATKEEFFESLLPEKGKFVDLWNLVRKTQKKEEETMEKDAHKNVVMEHRDGIVVLAMQANKSKKIYDEDWGSHPEPNHPSCMVVFDNRKDHQFVAIERAAMDTDKTAEILMNSLNYQLNRFGYKFEVVRLKRELPFMKAIYDIKEKLQDNVSRLVFSFDKHLDEKKKLRSRFVHALSEWIGKFADTGQVTANISNDEQLMNATIKQDLELIAELCSTNAHYNLLVKFQHFGLFRYGQDVKAQFGVDEKAIDKFFNKDFQTPTEKSLFGEDSISAREPETTLEEWLDNVQKLYIDYEEEALSVKKRKRTHRLGV